MSPGLLRRWVPDSLSPILAHLSPDALHVVEWRTLLADAPRLARRMTTGAGRDELRAHLEPWRPDRIAWCEASDGRALGVAKGTERIAIGEAFLELYFSQLRCEQGLFLDLRAEHFRLLGEGRIGWAPSPLWVRLDPAFREAMLELYHGFYGGDDARLDGALARLGLLDPDWPAATRRQLRELLDDHVGGGGQREVRFSLAHFRASFETLFAFLVEHRVRIPTDFLYLGVYLVTLYLSLEALGGTYDVRSIFERTDATASEIASRSGR